MTYVESPRRLPPPRASTLLAGAPSDLGHAVLPSFLAFFPSCRFAGMVESLTQARRLVTALSLDAGQLRAEMYIQTYT